MRLWDWLRATFRHHFGFSRTETNGGLFLLLFTLAALTAPCLVRLYQYRSQPSSKLANEDREALEKMVHELEDHDTDQQPPHSQTTHPPKKPRRAKQENPIAAFDINTASAKQLQQIKGIGPVLSKRMMQYKRKLGGFVSPQQYGEVYGVRDEVVKRLQEATYISPSFVPRQININTCSKKQLVAHPYLTQEQADAIWQHRRQHGPYAMTRDLLVQHLVTQRTWQRIQPYCTIGP